MDHELPPSSDAARPQKPLDGWITPLSAAPDTDVYGSDALLASELAEHGRTDDETTPVIWFHPTSTDIGRTIGILPTEDLNSNEGNAPQRAVPMDALREHELGMAVNHVICGNPPDFLGWGSSNASFTVEVDGKQVFRGRASSVVIATGQFVRGHDLLPKGHPGDGFAEVQVYALRRNERRRFRMRLELGTHLPHPRIVEAKGKHVRVQIKGRPFPVEADSNSWGAVQQLEVTVVPQAYYLAIP